MISLLTFLLFCGSATEKQIAYPLPRDKTIVRAVQPFVMKQRDDLSALDIDVEAIYNKDTVTVEITYPHILIQVDADRLAMNWAKEIERVAPQKTKIRASIFSRDVFVSGKAERKK